MAGGRADYLYTTDAGQTFALNQDTSNAGIAGNAIATNGQDFLPRSITPRFGMYQSQDGLRKRKVYAETVAKYLALPGTATLPDEAGNFLFTLIYTRGEKAKKSRSVNSGIQT